MYQSFSNGVVLMGRMGRRTVQGRPFQPSPDSGEAVRSAKPLKGFYVRLPQLLAVAWCQCLAAGNHENVPEPACNSYWLKRVG